MSSWLDFLKQGLTRTIPEDQLAGAHGYAGTRAGLANLRPFLARHWRKGAVGAVLIVLTSLSGLLPPLVTRYLVDDVILARQIGLLAGAVLLLVGLKGFGLLASPVQGYYFARFQQEILLDIQQALLERTLRFPKSFFDEQEVGYLMARLTSDVGSLSWFFSGTLVYIATDIVRFAGGAALLLYLEWRLALAVLVLLPLMVIAVRYFARKLRVLGHTGMEQQAHVSQQVQESLASTTLIKAFASERREVGRIMSQMRAAFQISMEQVVVGSLANLSLNTLSQVASGVGLVAGALLVIAGKWSLGSLLAFQSYLGAVYGPAQSLATANLQLQSALAALQRVSALFDIVPEEIPGTGRSVEHLKGAIELRDVSFSYDQGEPVLQQVSCTIEAGERVAIVGPSGVGKTTLVSLLLRFYKPTAGEIWFDGLPGAEYELASLRRRIGYAAQSALLLSGTIGENLRYGNPDATQEQVERAARAAGIHEYIAGLPNGYDSPVGERGVNLSEGQKQRLAIARALIKDPDILILDEPTAALDSLTERSLFEGLPELVRGKTLFVVAHRLATVQNSDRILVLNEHKLVAIGTHLELMASNDYYRSLVQNQQVLLSPQDSRHGSP